MIIFLLTAVPLFYFIMNSLWKNIKAIVEDSYKPFVYGLICFAVSVLIYNLIRVLAISPTYTRSGIYLYYLLHDHLIQFVLAVGSYFLVYGFSDMNSSGNGMERMFAFFCGFFCLWGVNDSIINYGWYNSYVLVVIPLIRIAMIAAATVLLSDAISSEGGKRWIMFLCTLAVPFALSVVPLFWRLSFNIAVIVLVPLMTGVSLFFFLKAALPREPKAAVPLTPEAQQ